MTIFLKDSEGSIISFDAVMSYDQDYSSKVTEHPLESGGNVSDHIIRNNKKIKVKGVFSDYSPSNNNEVFSANVDGQEFSSANITNSRIVSTLEVSKNNREINPPVDLTGSNYSINNPEGVSRKTQDVKKKLIELQRQGALVTIFETEGGTIKPSAYFPNAVITNLNISENENSGDGLYVSMSFNIVRFANTELVDVTSLNLKREANSQIKADAPDVTLFDTDPFLIPEIVRFTAKDLYQEDQDRQKRELLLRSSRNRRELSRFRSL